MRIPIAAKLQIVALLAVSLCGCRSDEVPDPDEPKATKTPSGLKIYDVKVGNGPEAKIGDVVSVHYDGRLRDGKMFDSSRKQNRPVRILLGETSILEGWREGILGMKLGGERKLFIPPSLGYGGTGVGREIPPNSDLLFDIDLLGVQPALLIEDLKVGEGPDAQPRDKLEVNYTGWLTNGHEFDSSAKRGKPIEVELGQNGVIQGWERGLIGMKKGGKRKLTIAPELAYGQEGRGEIPPMATLVFEVELVSIK